MAGNNKNKKKKRPFAEDWAKDVNYPQYVTHQVAKGKTPMSREKFKKKKQTPNIQDKWGTNKKKN